MNSPGPGEEEETLVIVKCLFFFLATQKSDKWGPKQEVGLEQEPRSVYKECFCLFWYCFFCLFGWWLLFCWGGRVDFCGWFVRFLSLHPSGNPLESCEDNYIFALL